MPAGLLAPYIPDSSDWFRSGAQGYALGDAMRNRDVSINAGQKAAAGDMGGARKEFYQGGNFEGANQITQMMRQASDDALKRTQRFHETLGNLALVADTPEKWAAATAAAQKAGIDVSKYSDFRARDMVLAQSGKTLDVLKMEADRRRVEGEQAIKREAIAARTAKAAMPKPRNLSYGDTQKLAKEGGQLDSVERFNTGFKDEYAGYGRGGAAAMFLARNLPIFTGEQTENAAAFWQDYDKYKNVVRNELFGSALTPGEQEEFAKADVDPNMDPKIIKKNLERQKSIVETALGRVASSMVAGGYNQEAIEAAIGRPVDQLKLAGKGQGQLTKEPGAESVVQVQTPEEALKLPPGTQFRTPDGRVKVRP